MKKIAITMTLILVMLTGCTQTASPAPAMTEVALPSTATPTVVPSATPFPTPIPSTTATPPPTPIPAATADSPIERIVAPLQGLPLETFFETSFYQLQLRDPDMLIEYPECYDVRHNNLPDLSGTYIRETQRLELAILELLHSYDRASLPPDQQLSYDVYEWYLDDLVRGHEFMYADFPINGYGEWDLTNRLVAATLALPITDRHEAEDYIERLSQTGVWVDQLLEGLRLRERAGVIPPMFLLEDALVQIEEHMQMQSPGVFNVDAIALYTAFDAQLEAVSGLGTQGKQTLRQAARAEIEQTFIPAFTELRDYLIYLQSIASDNASLSNLPNGTAYYAYLLHRYTGTDLSAEELHTLGQTHVARLQAEMQQVAVDLGYAPGLNMAEINQILNENSNSLEGESLLAEYERLLTDAKSAASDFFNVFPSADVIITYDPAAPVPGYYRNPPRNSSTSGVMIVNLQDPGASTLYNYIVLLNHETIPGHHVQLALALDLNPPTFRSTLCSNFYLKDFEYQGYVEGWAVYAQQLGWEMGLYGESHAMENLGRLRLMLNQVARMVVETGIHAKGWTREAAAAYFESATGRPTTARQMNRYVAVPGQAVSYNFGWIIILELRQQAKEQLGDKFDIKEFHDVILGNGPMPVGFLEKAVNDWVAVKLHQ